MARLIALSPCAGLLPVTAGTVTLTEADPGQMTSVAPLAGKTDEVAKVLEAAFGFAFPAPNMSHSGTGARILWAGRGRALLIGAPPPDGLSGLAALVDQSDGAAVVQIAGAGVRDVLARLVPLDLRPRAFAEGATARSLVGHMTAQITRTGDESFEIMVMRSMAATLVHDLTQAMAGIAARAAR